MKQPYVSSTILSEKLNIPASTIRAYRNKNGVSVREQFAPSYEEFIQLYDELKSSRKVAKYYGTNKTTILRYAKNIGYDTTYKKILTQEQEEVILQNYHNCTAKELAEKFNVSQSKITQIWRQHGLIGKENRVYKINNQKYFNIITSVDQAYFLGFIGSDGCVYHSNYNKQDILRISIQKEDVKILELFKQCLETDKPIYTTKEKYASLEISSQQIFDDLCALNLKPRKTYSNTIANIDDNLMPHLIRGYFDGDGTIRRSAQSDVEISISGYYNNMEKIQSFLEKHNIFSTFIEDKRKYHDAETGIFGQLIIPNRYAKYAFLKLIYTECGEYYLDRKHKIAFEFINYIESSEQIRDKQIKIYYDYAVQKVS